MTKITIKEKTEDISWEEIRKCLWLAHEENRKRGILFKTVMMSDEQLYQHICHKAEKWAMFVALDGEKLVGCSGVAIKQRNAWFSSGRIGYLMLTGVLPEYRGRHLNTRFVQVREEWILKNGVDVAVYDTADRNIQKIKKDLAHGYLLVDFIVPKGVDHYSVIMCKWLKKCPYTKYGIKIRYITKKLIRIFRFKTGGKKRFGI